MPEVAPAPCNTSAHPFTDRTLAKKSPDMQVSMAASDDDEHPNSRPEPPGSPDGQHSAARSNDQESPEDIHSYKLIPRPEGLHKSHLRRTKKRVAFADFRGTYWSTLEWAASVDNSILKHLNKVQDMLAYQRITGSISIFDFSANSLAVHDKLDALDSAAVVSGTYRVILAEPPYTSTQVNTLGSRYLVHPEFFAEHSAQSFDETRAWMTGLWAKDYATLRWLRPVYTSPATVIDPSWRRLRSYGFLETWNPSRFTGAGFMHGLASWEERVSLFMRAREQESPETLFVQLDHSPEAVNTVADTYARYDQAALAEEARRCWSDPHPKKAGEERLSLHFLPTAGIMKQMMYSLKGGSASPESIERNVLSTLMKTIFKDSLMMLNLLELKINEIRVHASGRNSPQQHHDEWQRIIGNSRQAIREMLHHTKHTIEVIRKISTASTWSFYRLHGSYHNPDFDSEEMRAIYNDFQSLMRDVEACKEDVIEVSNLLVSNMSMLVSQKQIAESEKQLQESESITKLTELAFFFVPLAFSATLFGMQVEEFENVELSTWVYTAAGCVLGSYAVRLLVRSRLVHWTRGRIMPWARRKLSLPTPAPIPTMSLVGLALRVMCKKISSYYGSRRPRMFGLSVRLSILALASAMPIVLLWTVGEVASSVRVGLSVLFALLGITLLVECIRWLWRQYLFSRM